MGWVVVDFEAAVGSCYPSCALLPRWGEHDPA